ncbi:hypothetical protein LOC67_17220 [Stieleria sp. JC731]|uniref:hypothetical protein n=1 Tax=Pirellulaceae TaxID=2691357 RepID=UPI001E379456|nr:hypothetical protein [Stieleria sp. JC731]MCC9602298.1 hypothetical protein [Stieleria sp. JC731]
MQSRDQVEGGGQKGARGLFRDKKRLVVDLHDHQFENLCLVTGETPNDAYKIDQTVIPASTQTISVLIGGLMGYYLMAAVQGVKVKLVIPYKNQMLERDPKRSATSKMIVGVGFAILIVAIAALDPKETLGMAVLLFGVFMIFSGFVHDGVVGSKTTQPYLPSDIRGDYVWIAGVNEDVISRYPVFSPKE